MRRNILIANVVLCFMASFCFGQEYKTVREARARRSTCRLGTMRPLKRRSKRL